MKIFIDIRSHFSRHESLFTPALPIDKTTAIEKISIGVIGKIILSFPKDVCTGNNTSSLFLWKNVDFLVHGPIWGKIMSTTCPMGANNVITIWTPGPIAAAVSIKYWVFMHYGIWEFMIIYFGNS